MKPVAANGLDASRVERIVADRTARLARRDEALPLPTIDILVFAHGMDLLALPLSAVAGIVAAPRLTRLPDPAPGLRGVFAWRGQLHNLFDPVPSLGLAMPAADDATALVLRHDRPRLALAVGRVEGTRAIPRHIVDAGGAILRPIEADDDRLLLIDPAALADRLLAPHQEG